MNALAAKPTSQAPPRRMRAASARSPMAVHAAQVAQLTSKSGCACGGTCPRCQATKSNLQISQPTDPAEIEADRLADQIMRTPTVRGAGVRPAPLGMQLKKRSASSGTSVGGDIGAKVNASRAGGSALDTNTRGFMELRFGSDLSDVRVHTGSDAAELNQRLGARAFTFGRHIFFNSGEYRPHNENGRRLIAHELVHTRQQSHNTLWRCANPVVNDPKYDANAAWLKKHPKYIALADKTEADQVFVEAKKKAPCLYLLGQFQTLLDTPEKSAATITTETNASTATAVTAEKTRVAAAPPADLTIEETASKDPKRTWVKIPGKFGGGKYEVDRTNPKNIVVRAKIFLKPAGTGVKADVDNVKAMEDGIEKAASAKGFIVDIEFVAAAGGDAFEVEVNPGEWETATNWSGGAPLGFAHELFHLMYYEIDRYNYIDAHATNQSMMIPDRIHWFLIQIKKPAGWDNPASIAASGPHPLDDDVCRVAGLPEADCIKERTKP